jgi:REP element-mobilizing transposase RayT
MQYITLPPGVTKGRTSFFSNTDYKKFLEYLSDAKKKFKIIVHSYVLMSNHYHLILETPGANLSKAMHYIKKNKKESVLDMRQNRGNEDI